MKRLYAMNNLDGIDGWMIRYYVAVMGDPVPF